MSRIHFTEGGFYKSVKIHGKYWWVYIMGFEGMRMMNIDWDRNEKHNEVEK